MTDTAKKLSPLPLSRSQSGEREPVLHHYTNFAGLVGIVSSKALWCSKIQYLNDSTELRHGLDILARIYTEICGEIPTFSDPKEFARRFHSVSVFVCSFSDASNVLSQWRGYSGQSGVSVEFSFKKLNEKISENGFRLKKCVYSQAEKISITREFVQEQLAQNTTGNDFADAYRMFDRFLPVAAQFKNDSFSEEQEWRLISPPISIAGNKIKVRANDSGLIPYVDFDLKTGRQPLKSEKQPWRTHEDICVTSVMVGPNREQELQMSAVGDLFSANNAHIDSVGRSFIPFRVM